MTDTLFSPLALGQLTLNNRIVMAPMTRNRADADGCVNDLMVAYYAQRASAGLLIAEGTYPCKVGQAYARQPGIANDQHVLAWQKVTTAVHAQGGRVFLQMMHAGRVGNEQIKGKGVATLAPSAISAQGQVFTDTAGMQPFAMPQEMTLTQIQEAIADHHAAAVRAKKAGFDGVELHCTSGYLPMQFLCTGSNHRDDAYGGSVVNRCRFVIECLEALIDVFGAGQVGIRINPGNAYNDCPDEDSLLTHTTLLRLIQPLALGYCHVMRAPVPEIDAFALVKAEFSGRIIVNDSIALEEANQLIHQGDADAVSFARHYIANPDLVARLKHGLPLAKFDRKTLYTPGAAGYTDYPLYQQES